ncbi:hypothetical protein [Xenorhabdus sp. IM139775]|uniref:hypothetical protein n=1 Tax=Xenorhabdus sp. IM139775 TaxID=3025876 RepID=UPI0023583382|nr:hypothetical protein [Xenorhabdus sp. IM139775]MDC9594693.1 hypothetical protein [Xenorhabdus sp. IM139775]
MTTPNTVNYPPPADWQHFERLSVAIMSAIFQKRFRQYGRSGQRQDGVDLYCKHNGTFIAVQCKGRNQRYGSLLSPEDITNAVKSTEKFPHKIDEFYILTTGPDDKNLEQRAFELSCSHSETDSFTVHVLGWQTLENIIREHDSIQHAFYSGFFKRFSIKQYSTLIATGCLLITLSILGVYRYVNYYSETSAQQKATSKDTEEFVALNDKLIKIYKHCDEMMNANILSSSFELKQFCTIPIAKQLDSIDKFVQKASLSIDARAYDNMRRMIEVLREDHWQGLIAVEMTRFFENNIIRSLKVMCLPEKQQNKDVFKEMRTTAEDAVNQQLQFYYILNDFILPGMESMKAIALTSARQINDQPVPHSMFEQANRLSGILKERSEYKLNKSQIPFSLSVMKIYSGRNIKMSASIPDPAEEFYWNDVLVRCIGMSFLGRNSDAQELVKCGVFRAEAPEHFRKEENEIRKKAESL